MSAWWLLLLVPSFFAGAYFGWFIRYILCAMGEGLAFAAAVAFALDEIGKDCVILQRIKEEIDLEKKNVLDMKKRMKVGVK